MMKNVLIFSCYLPAKRYGGPLKSVYNLVESTFENCNYYLISLDHDFKEKKKLDGIKEGWNIVGHARVKYINEKDFTEKNIEMILKEINPEVLYLSSVFYWRFNFPACKAARKLRIPVLLATRSDLLPNCISHKRYKKIPYLLALKIFGQYRGVFYHSTSKEETESIKKWMGVQDDVIYEMPNISSVPLQLTKKPKSVFNLSLIYCGRIHPRKNVKYAIECLKNVKRNVSLDIYGSLEDESYWRECRLIINSLPKNVTVTYRGNLSPLDVQKEYYLHDALLFPTLNENYGHVIVEAMIAGCVPIISKGTTPWDECSKFGGYSIDLSDQESFSNAIDKLADEQEQDFKKRRVLLEKFCELNFNNTALSNKYLSVFKELHEKTNEKKHCGN